MANPLINFIWDSLEPELQDAMTLAYNQACRDGSDILRTRYLFAAINKLNPELFNDLPQSVLPSPIDDQVTTKGNVLLDNYQLSPCITDSANHLYPLQKKHIKC